MFVVVFVVVGVSFHSFLFREVPWGELVGDKSFETLDQIFTGYGEDGPGQGKLVKHGMTDEMYKKYPDLDYILSCEVTDEEQQPHLAEEVF
jgi:hypothetical protein